MSGNIEVLLKREARLLRPVATKPNGRPRQKNYKNVRVYTEVEEQIRSLLIEISDLNVAWQGRVIRLRPEKWGKGQTSEEVGRSRYFNEVENQAKWVALVERLTELEKKETLNSV